MSQPQAGQEVPTHTVEEVAARVSKILGVEPADLGDHELFARLPGSTTENCTLQLRKMLSSATEREWRQATTTFLKDPRYRHIDNAFKDDEERRDEDKKGVQHYIASRKAQEEQPLPRVAGDPSPQLKLAFNSLARKSNLPPDTLTRRLDHPDKAFGTGKAAQDQKTAAFAALATVLKAQRMLGVDIVNYVVPRPELHKAFVKYLKESGQADLAGRLDALAKERKALRAAL